jgi:hypothetical protein
MGEEPGCSPLDIDEPGSCCGRSALESLELVHGPPDQVLIDAPCKEVQLGARAGLWQGGVVG